MEQDEILTQGTKWSLPMQLTATNLIDINELSRRLSVPKGTLYNWVYLRRIPFLTAGRSLRFEPDEVIQSLPHSRILDLAGQRWKGH